MLKRRLALQLLLVPGTLHNIIDTQFRNSLQYNTPHSTLTLFRRFSKHNKI